MARAENQNSPLVDKVTVKLPGHCRRKDPEILAAAREAIDTITTIRSDSMHIAVRDGWITIEGAVQNAYQKEAVEFAISYLVGLTGISNLLVTATEPGLYSLN